MQFTELSAYPLVPGTLGQWMPTAERDFDKWRPDDRGTSYVHEAHLRGAYDLLARRRIVGGRESWLAVGIEFDEPLSIPGLREALTAWINRHEVLRTHVILQETDAGERSDGETDAGERSDGETDAGERTVVRRSLPADGVELDLRMIGTYHSVDPLRDQLQGEFDRATAPLTWPAYMFATVARPDSFTLFFAADHSLVDGYSLVLAPHEIASLYRKATKGSPARLLPTGSYVDFSAAERKDAARADADHRAARLWRAHLHESGGEMASFPMPLLPTSAAALAVETKAALTHDAEGVPRIPQGALNFHLLDDDRTNKFTLVCSEAGATLVTGVLACMARINTDLGFGPVFRCVIPRHTRNAEQWLAALGWFVAIAPFRLDTTGARGFGDLARRAQQQWKQSKPGTELPFLRVGELIGTTPTPRFVISFMDTRSAPGAAYNDAGGAAVLRSRDYSIEDVYLWVNRTPSGLHVAARFPGFETARRAVTLYLGALRSLLTEIGDSSAYGGGVLPVPPSA